MHGQFRNLENRLQLNDHRLFFFLILLFGLILRVFSIEDNGLWVDEVWSMWASHSSRTIPEIIQLCIDDTHPPLFDILLHGALLITNDYEFTARYLSLIFGMLGLLLTYYYAHKLSDSKRIALISMALASFNYFHIIYSMEGRFYSLVYILSILSLGHLFLFVKHRRIKHLVIFVIVNILFVYTHYYGAIYLIVLSLLMLGLLLIKQINLKAFVFYTLGCVVVLISFLPWLPYMLSKEGVASWIPLPKLSDFFLYIGLYTGKNPIESAILFIPIVFAFTVYQKRKSLIILLVGSVLLGFLVPFLVSVISTPMLHVRYTIFYFPAMFILAAIFWDRLKWIPETTKKWLAAIVFLSMMASVMIFSVETKPGYKDGWKEASLILNRVDADRIYTEHLIYLNYYLDYHGAKSAGDLEDYARSEPNEFWWLSTIYDSKNLIEADQLEVVQEHPLPNGFILYKVRR